jgi:anti-sigma factor RsiW
MSSHISFEHLVDLIDGRLQASERASVQEHTATCPQCAAELSAVEHTIEIMRNDTSEEPPDQAIARAVHLFRSRTPVAARQPSVRQRLIAVLRFDSAQQPLAFGMRTGQAGPRQLVFSAEGRHVDLRVMPVGDTWVLAGQVLGAGAGGEAKLQGPYGTARTELNAQCEFTMPGVKTGTYTLTLGLPDIDLEITDLSVS